jgi:hypothetical protein
VCMKKKKLMVFPHVNIDRLGLVWKNGASGGMSVSTYLDCEVVDEAQFLACMAI